MKRWFKSAITCIDPLNVHVYIYIYIYSFSIDVMFLCFRSLPGMEVFDWIWEGNRSVWVNSNKESQGSTIIRTESVTMGKSTNPKD